MPVTIREAAPADLDVVMRHRRSTFADMGNRERAALDAMDATSRPLYDSLGFTPTNEMRLPL